MKRNVWGLVLFLLMASFSVEAHQAYHYSLNANKQIKSSCYDGDEKKKSRLKLVIVESNPVYTNVKFKAYLCTKGYGFRLVKLWVNLPNILFDTNQMLSVSPSQKLKFDDIKSTKQEGRTLSLLFENIGRNSNFSFPVVDYQISWQKNLDGSIEYEPFILSVSNPQHLSHIPGFDALAHRSWAAMKFVFKHPMVSRPFILDGNLHRVSEE